MLKVLFKEKRALRKTKKNEFLGKTTARIKELKQANIDLRKEIKDLIKQKNIIYNNIYYKYPMFNISNGVYKSLREYARKHNLSFQKAIYALSVVRKEKDEKDITIDDLEKKIDELRKKKKKKV